MDILLHKTEICIEVNSILSNDTGEEKIRYEANLVCKSPEQDERIINKVADTEDLALGLIFAEVFKNI